MHPCVIMLWNAREVDRQARTWKKFSFLPAELRTIALLKMKIMQSRKMEQMRQKENICFIKVIIFSLKKGGSILQLQLYPMLKFAVLIPKPPLRVET